MRLARTCFLVLLTGFLQACQTLMPSSSQPYRVLAPGSAPVAGAPWRWTDERPTSNFEIRETQAGVLFGDAVIEPRPFEAVQQLFLQTLNAHGNAAELRARLAGKTLRLTGFESSAGLHVRLSERQQGQWQFMRVMLAVDVDGKSYSALDVHKFSNSESPSPLAAPLRNAVENLVRQIDLFP